jgi:putative endonuclease
MRPCVYILASERNGTLYIGVTSDLAQRVWVYKMGAVEGFTKRYAVYRLVYVEFHDTMELYGWPLDARFRGHDV